MAPSTTHRPVGVAPDAVPGPDRPARQGAVVQVNPDAPTVLSALHWNEIFGPWVRGRHNCRPVVEAALAQARTRGS